MGRRAIVENLANYNLTLGAGREQRHVTSNVSVHLDGDHGTGSAYFIFCVGYDGKIESTAFGHYRDELRKVDGRWSRSQEQLAIFHNAFPGLDLLPPLLVAVEAQEF